MGRKANTKCIEAEELFKAGMQLNKIAEKLGVPEGTIRRWKCEKKWELDQRKENERSAKNNERSENKKTNVRKRGGQSGNRNAAGGKGNTTNHVIKHGGYTKVYRDTLDSDEIDMIDDMPENEEFLLIEQIRLFTVRERRIMQAINRYRQLKADVTV